MIVSRLSVWIPNLVYVTTNHTREATSQNNATKDIVGGYRTNDVRGTPERCKPTNQAVEKVTTDQESDKRMSAGWRGSGIKLTYLCHLPQLQTVANVKVQTAYRGQLRTAVMVKRRHPA